MDFENLAFGPPRRVAAATDRYCPACREICDVCEFEETFPTCPTCGERTIARPAAVGDGAVEVGFRA